MPKTEDMIHKQALDSAWDMLKFYGTYEPHGHRAYADDMRRQVGRLDERIEESNPISDYDKRYERGMRDDRNAMLQENPDIRERTDRMPGDIEIMNPRARDYERGALPDTHPDHKRGGNAATPDKKSESRVSTRDKVKDPESAPGESSFRTRGTGESPLDSIPEWLINPGNKSDEIHPMYHDRFKEMSTAPN